MSTYSLANFVWDASLFTSGLFIGTKIFVQPSPKTERFETKKEIELKIEDLKNSINTDEICVKKIEEAIKTIRRELEEALKMLREENTEEVTVKNKRKQLENFEKLRLQQIDSIEYFKNRLEKCEKRLEKFESEGQLLVE